MIGQLELLSILKMKSRSIDEIKVYNHTYISKLTAMKGVQLIAFDSNKNPYIPKDSLLVLKSLNTNNLHVISVAGKYRTGKSYILNRVLLNKNKGFNVGHTINACTKGLWMWPELVKLNGKDCLIIDTEGLGSLQEGESTDLKIFLLALLFSSQLVYNSIGSIDEQAIESLSLVIQLATLLQRQDKYDTQELVNTFPSFMWLLRDFSLKLENQKGVAITPQEYLQHALKHQNRTTPAAERKNQIRKQLRTFFQERDCFALVRPTEEQRDLQNLSSVEDSKLRPQFVCLVAELKKRLSETVKPKRVRGKVLSMDGFIELCQYYTKALVDGRLPTISSHWDNLCLSQTHRIFQKFQLQHLKALQSLENDMEQIATVHKQIVKEGLQAIEKSFLGKLEKQLFKERFERKLEGQLQQLKGRMSFKKTREVKEMLEHLQQETCQDDPLIRYEAVIMKMSQISESSTKDNALYCQFYLYLCQFARNLLEDSSNRYLELQRITNDKVAFLDYQLTQEKQESQEEIIRLQSQIEELRRKVNELTHIAHVSQSSNSQRHQLNLYCLQSQVKELSTKFKELSYQLQLSKEEETRLRELQGNQRELVKKLQETVFQRQKEIMQKDSLMSMETIRCRKVLREKDIIKQRYEENLQENLALRNKIDELQAKINHLENEKYQGNITLDVQQLRNSLKLVEEERNNIRRVLQQQTAAFEAMMHAPQNMSYMTLKRNLEMEEEKTERLQQRADRFISILNSCSSITCAKCNTSISAKYAEEHFGRCCSQSVEYDVSYSYNLEGQIQYQISISKSLSQRIIRRNIEDVQLFICQNNSKEQWEQLQRYEEQGERLQQIRVIINQILDSSKWQRGQSKRIAEFLGEGVTG